MSRTTAIAAGPGGVKTMARLGCTRADYSDSKGSDPAPLSFSQSRSAENFSFSFQPRGQQAKPRNIPPLALVRVNGVWTVDVAACVAALGDQLKSAQNTVQQITAIANSATAAVAAGKYPDADHLAKDIANQVDKVQ